MPVTSSDRAYKKLKELFSLPDHCTKAVITLELNNVVTVEATYHAELNEDPITEKFFLCTNNVD